MSTMTSSTSTTKTQTPRPGAKALLKEASDLWRTHPELAVHARRAWRGGFASGSVWMDAVRRTRAGRPLRAGTGGLVRRNALGLLKNGGAALVAAAAALLAAAAAASRAVGDANLLAGLVAAVIFVVVFYAVEGQMVFLFPLLDDEEDAAATGGPPVSSVLGLLAACRRQTVRAGGTLAVMRVVMPISARMIFGGLFGMGAFESWCLGCIAVVCWHEEVSR